MDCRAANYIICAAANLCRNHEFRRRAARGVRRSAGAGRRAAVSRERAARPARRAERVEEVAHHYELFDGVSPLTELTMRQADAAAIAADATRHRRLPVYVGMRNWHPFLADTLPTMSRAGVRRAVGFMAAAQRSYSGCTQYRGERRRRARDARATRASPTSRSSTSATGTRILASSTPMRITSRDALAQLPPDVRERARLVFTAHSIPVSMAERYPYQRQLEETACGGRAQRRRAAAGRATTGRSSSRAAAGGRRIRGSGRTSATTCAMNAREASRAAVLCPIGFLCDHIEVLYDLDVEAAAVCRDIRLPMVRASAVNDHPRFIDAMADAVIADDRALFIRQAAAEWWRLDMKTDRWTLARAADRSPVRS